MIAESRLSQSLVRQAVCEILQLRDDDLARVIDFIHRLRREAAAQRAREVAEVRSAAAYLAGELATLPRAEQFARFRAALEDIRVQAIAENTAIDEEWSCD
jgi:hypothetical protein